MNVDVAVGGSASVLVAGTAVSVGDEVTVEKSGMEVTPGMGVRVGIFGTQSLCPV
jgi:hypothetical protein